MYLSVDYTGTEFTRWHLGCSCATATAVPEITTSERGTIIRLKNGKSLRIDSITAEMLKCMQDDAIKNLRVLFNKIISKQKLLSDWRRSPFGESDPHM